MGTQEGSMIVLKKKIGSCVCTIHTREQPSSRWLLMCVIAITCVHLSHVGGEYFTFVVTWTPCCCSSSPIWTNVLSRKMGTTSCGPYVAALLHHIPTRAVFGKACNWECHEVHPKPLIMSHHLFHQKVWYKQGVTYLIMSHFVHNVILSKNM